MMLNAAWIMVAAFCIGNSSGYAIPNMGKPDPTATGVYGGHHTPSKWPAKPVNGWDSGNGTAQDPTKRIPDPTPGAGIPYSKGPYASYQAPTIHGKGKPQPGYDSSADGHEPWMPLRNGTAAGATSKRPYSAPCGDHTGKPEPGSESGSTDGHVPWPSPDGTRSSADGRLPDDTDDEGRPWTRPTPPAVLSPYQAGKNRSDCASTAHKFQSPYKGSRNNGTQLVWNGTDTSPAHKPSHTHGDKTGSESEDEDEDEDKDEDDEDDDDDDDDEEDSGDKPSPTGHSVYPFPTPRGEAQSPSLKGPYKAPYKGDKSTYKGYKGPYNGDDDDDRSPSSQYPPPIYHPVSSPSVKRNPGSGGY